MNRNVCIILISRKIVKSYSSCKLFDQSIDLSILLREPHYIGVSHSCVVGSYGSLQFRRQHFSPNVFIANLINTTSGVELLDRKEIIQNYLTGDQEVRDMLSKLSVEICMLQRPTQLKQLFEEVDEFSHSRLRRRGAWIRHKYNNPWLVLSLMVATIVLVCGIVQTSLCCQRIIIFVAAS